jgi:hypothetical protein
MTTYRRNVFIDTEPNQPEIPILLDKVVENYSTEKKAAFAFLIFFVYCGIIILILTGLSFFLLFSKETIQLDNKGQPIIGFYNLTQDWEDSPIVRDVKNLRREKYYMPFITKTNVELGYYKVYINSIGWRNLTINNTYDTFKRACKNHVCINAYQLMIDANIIYMSQTDDGEEELFLISPTIVTASDKKQKVYSKNVYSNVIPDPELIKNWKDIPQTIIVEALNMKGYYERLKLTDKRAACVYLSTNQ